MAKCYKCKGEVAIDAKICPHCGIKSPLLKQLWIGIFAVIGFIVLLSNCGQSTEEKLAAATTPAEVAVAVPNGPLCTQDKMWEFVINNAYRTAEEYAMNKNNNSYFVSVKNPKTYVFSKQVDGANKDKYFLTITNKHGYDRSVGVLEPLFDVDKPSTNLDDEKPLWKVVSAKLNGIPY